jgi:hypothetical protein
MAQEKTCARCGGSFGCGRNDANCWCSALPPLPGAALDELKDCYCPRCLADIVAAHKADTAPDPHAE